MKCRLGQKEGPGMPRDEAFANNRSGGNAITGRADGARKTKRPLALGTR